MLRFALKVKYPYIQIIAIILHFGGACSQYAGPVSVSGVRVRWVLYLFMLI